MKMLEIGSRANASAVALGCMRMASLDEKQIDSIMGCALENGVNFFDHADISGFRSPRCSTVFTLILPPTMMMSTGLVIPIGRSLPTSAHEARTFAKLIHLGREQVLLRIQVAPMEG